MTDNTDTGGHPVVEVQCRSGHRRAIHPGEIGPYEVPLCVECREPRVMFAKSTHSCSCEWVPPNKQVMSEPFLTAEYVGYLATCDTCARRGRVRLDGDAYICDDCWPDECEHEYTTGGNGTPNGADRDP